MPDYKQYCPIARAAEILAVPWMPIVLRNLVAGAESFNALAGGAPGLSRSTLTKRLAELKRRGLIDVVPKEVGQGNIYRLTSSGEALAPVLQQMGEWALANLGLDPTNSDPGFLLHSWCAYYLNVRNLPERQVVVRFEFVDQPKPQRVMWILFNQTEAEVCVEYPGIEEDLVVTAESTGLAEWHLGQAVWTDLIAQRRLSIAGAPRLARELPTWVHLSDWAGPRKVAQSDDLDV